MSPPKHPGVQLVVGLVQLGVPWVAAPVRRERDSHVGRGVVGLFRRAAACLVGHGTLRIKPVHVHRTIHESQRQQHGTSARIIAEAGRHRGRRTRRIPSSRLASPARTRRAPGDGPTHGSQTGCQSNARTALMPLDPHPGAIRRQRTYRRSTVCGTSSTPLRRRGARSIGPRPCIGMSPPRKTVHWDVTWSPTPAEPPCVGGSSGGGSSGGGSGGAGSASSSPRGTQARCRRARGTACGPVAALGLAHSRQRRPGHSPRR